MCRLREAAQEAGLATALATRGSGSGRSPDAALGLAIGGVDSGKRVYLKTSRRDELSPMNGPCDCWIRHIQLWPCGCYAPALGSKCLAGKPAICLLQLASRGE